jgi:hypothetical protein
MAAQGLMYSAAITNVSSGTAAVDILVIGTSSTVPILLHELRMTSAGTTDTRLSLQVIRRTAAPTGGTGVTPRPLNLRNTVASTATVTSLPASNGTAGNVIESELWSVLVPYSRIYTPDERIIIPVSAWLALTFATAPGSAVNISAEAIFEEL